MIILFSPNPSLSAAPTENYQYGMLPNFFVGQTPPRSSAIQSRTDQTSPADRSDRSLRPVRPVPWCSVLRHSHSSRLFLLRLALAWKKNWRSLCCCILRNDMANLRFLHHCPRMFGMIGLRPIHNMPHKRCPLLIIRHIILAKHLQATMRPILLG